MGLRQQDRPADADWSFLNSPQDAHPEDSISPGFTGTQYPAQGPNQSIEETPAHAARQQVFDSADSILNKYAPPGPVPPGTDKQKILQYQAARDARERIGAEPERANVHMRDFYKRITPGTGGMPTYDPEMGDLEQAAFQLQKIQGAYRQQNQLSSQGGQEAYQSQSGMVGLEGTPETPEQQDEAAGMGMPIDGSLTMNHVLTAAGWNRPDFIKANTEMWRMLQTHGIQPTDPVSPSTFGVIVPKLVEEMFSPQVADKFFAEITQPAGGPDEKPVATPQKPERPEDEIVNRGLSDVTNRLSAMQQRHDAIWQELGQGGNFKNVGDAIGFVLTSIVLGPRAGAMLFSNMQKNGALRGELDQVNRETQMLYHQQDSYVQLAQRAREQAAMEGRSNATLQERAQHDRAIEGYQRMKLASAGQSAFWSPDEKKTDMALQHGWRYQSANLKAAEQDVQSKQRDVDNMNKIIMNGDPRHPLYEKARSGIQAAMGDLAKLKKTASAQRQALLQYEEQANNWYLRHGGEDIQRRSGAKVDGSTLTLPPSQGDE